MQNGSNILSIASVTAEVAPFSKEGGLGEVLRALPRALADLGHKIIIITPLYKGIKNKSNKWGIKKILKNVKIPLGDSTTKVHYWKTTLPNGVEIYFVDHEKCFSDHLKIHGAKNDHQRFYLLCVAALELLLELDHAPDVIQCNDWHSGLIPELLKKNYQDTVLEDSASVFTIHNLTFQLGMGWWNVPLKYKDMGKTPIPNFNDEKLKYTNFAKRAILYADIINTVSVQYAKEILTKKFGQDLHRILKNRKHKLYGIVNGIDYNNYNPSTDPGLIANYDYNSLHLKTKNKLYLQKIFKLPENPKIPLMGMVSRLFEQKGFNLIFKIIEPLMRMNLQFIVWGGGDKGYESNLKKLMKRYPKKIAANLKLTTKHATRVYAGSDFILMPSRFEPCGLTQLEGLRYGAIPIVHEVGGLADTIDDYDPKKHRGNGFIFIKYDPLDLLVAITRAIENHKYKESWLGLVRGAMQQSFSWEIPAKKYVKLFRKAIHNKHNTI